MMELSLPRAWKEEFAFAAAAKREDILHREKLNRFEEQQRKRKEEDRIEQRQDDAADLIALSAVLAPPQEIAEFKIDLEHYDTATVDVLLDNETSRNSVRAKINELLNEAAVLPDGRRVFKTMDGTRVFDEHGVELSPDIIDPQNIDDKKPKWETYKGTTDEYARLEEERQQVLAYQAKLDEARDRLDKGEITKKELETIKADLSESMPLAVREKLGADAPALPSKTPDTTPSNHVAALPSDMDNLLRGSGLAPAGPSGP